MTGQEEPLSPIERRVFGLDRTPPPPHLAALGREMVDRTRLTFKLFRRDFEAAGSTATAAMKQGEISRADAADLFLDLGACLSAPLVEHYLAAGECAKIADCLRARLDFSSLEWLNPRNRLAIEGLVGQGEAALAVALLRQHLHKAMTLARSRWRHAGSVVKALAAGKEVPGEGLDLLERMPAELDLVMLEIAECEPWIAKHGAKSDAQSLADMREEIARARSRLLK